MTEPLTNLSDVLCDVLHRKLKMREHIAAALAEDLVIGAAELGHGGTSYRLHTLDHLTRAEVAEAVRREYNGRNVRVLASRYNRSRATIYRIVRRNEGDAQGESGARTESKP